MTDCYCDYEPAEFYSKTTPKARKVHRCEECGHSIKSGAHYERVAAKWDGCVSTCKTCSDCVGIRQWLSINLPCFCWAHGSLFDDAKNAIEDAYYRAPDEVEGLWFGFLRRRILASRKNLGEVA